MAKNHIKLSIIFTITISCWFGGQTYPNQYFRDASCMPWRKKPEKVSESRLKASKTGWKEIKVWEFGVHEGLKSDIPAYLSTRHVNIQLFTCIYIPNQKSKSTSTPPMLHSCPPFPPPLLILQSIFPNLIF